MISLSKSLISLASKKSVFSHFSLSSLVQTTPFLSLCFDGSIFSTRSGMMRQTSGFGSKVNETEHKLEQVPI